MYFLQKFNVIASLISYQEPKATAKITECSVVVVPEVITNKPSPRARSAIKMGVVWEPDFLYDSAGIEVNTWNHKIHAELLKMNLSTTIGRFTNQSPLNALFIMTDDGRIILSHVISTQAPLRMTAELR